TVEATTHGIKTGGTEYVAPCVHGIANHRKAGGRVDPVRHGDVGIKAHTEPAYQAIIVEGREHTVIMRSACREAELVIIAARIVSARYPTVAEGCFMHCFPSDIFRCMLRVVLLCIRLEGDAAWPIRRDAKAIVQDDSLSSGGVDDGRETLPRLVIEFA